LLLSAALLQGLSEYHHLPLWQAQRQHYKPPNVWDSAQLQISTVDFFVCLCRACQSTITSLCGKLSGSITQLIPCLKTHMSSTSFAPECKETLTAAFARKGLNYNLQPELQKACNADVQRLCPGLGQAAAKSDPTAAAAVAKLQRLRNLQQTTGAAAADAADAAAAEATDSTDGSSSSKGSEELVCLSKHLSELGPGCRQEVAAEVHRELTVYMPGLPLTAACDGDAKKMCNAGGCGMTLERDPNTICSLVCTARHPHGFVVVLAAALVHDGVVACALAFRWCTCLAYR
jgi:hypothetical protein